MKHKTALFAFSTFTILGLTGCETPKPKPQPTSLEIQAFQKQTVDTSKKVAFAATMSVFQDLGYTIQSASFETGFITAQSPTSEIKSGDDGLGTMLAALSILSIAAGGGGRAYSPTPSTVSTSFTRATAFIEDLNEAQSSIRLNFVNSKLSSSSYGQTNGQDKPILEPTMYQNAFTKIGEAIFIRHANMPSAGVAVAQQDVADDDNSPEANLNTENSDSMSSEV